MSGIDARSTLTGSLMEEFAEDNANVLELTGSYNTATQRWDFADGRISMRTNYQTWNQTQMTTSQHTANNDYVPDYPSDTDPDTASD